MQSSKWMHKRFLRVYEEECLPFRSLMQSTRVQTWRDKEMKFKTFSERVKTDVVIKLCGLIHWKLDFRKGKGIQRPGTIKFKWTIVVEDALFVHSLHWAQLHTRYVEKKKKKSMICMERTTLKKELGSGLPLLLVTNSRKIYLLLVKSREQIRISSVFPHFAMLFKCSSSMCRENITDLLHHTTKGQANVYLFCLLLLWFSWGILTA